MSDNLEDIDRSGEEEALEFLWLHNPMLAKAIEKAVRLGESPTAIKQRVHAVYGPSREPLAKRAELAAQHLARGK